MGYNLQRHEPVESAVQRIATEQVDRALAELADPQLDGHEAVHQGRKRCKKVRALLRLVRPVFEPSYGDENAWYRDAARELAPARDAQAAVETQQRLVARYAQQLEPAAVAEVGAWLAARRDALAADERGLREGIERFQQRLLQGRARIEQWSLQRHGFEAVCGGLLKTYRRGARAMATAYRTPTSLHFHDWRKRVKYHWYHLRLLRNLHPPVLKAHKDQADRLAQLLGEEHDLAVLSELLTQAHDQLQAATVQVLLGLMDRQRRRLQRQARRPGALLYCEKPRRLGKRLACYWAANMA